MGAVLIDSQVGLSQPQAHSPTVSSYQVCISGAHSFFLVVCLQIKSLCRSALVLESMYLTHCFPFPSHYGGLIGFPGGSVVKDPPAAAGDADSIPLLRRSPVGGNGHPLQYSCLKNSMDRGAWWSIVHGIAKTQT